MSHEQSVSHASATQPLLVRLCLNRWTLTVLIILIAFPLVLTIGELWRLLWGAGWADSGKAIHAAEELIEGIGVVLIAWGVALEERPGVAALLGGTHVNDDPYEQSVDDLCHHYGLALLIYGLFAEMAMECVKLPDHIINTNTIERYPLSLSALCLVAGAYSLVALAIRMMLLRRTIV